MKRCTATLCLTIAICLCGISCAQVQGQGTMHWTATFDGSPPIARGSNIGIAQYSEQGMWFHAIGSIPTEPPYHLGRNGGGFAGFPENGTAYLQALLGDSLSVSSLRGQPFSLVSVDLAEYSTAFQIPLTVPFIGYLADGSTVTTSFTTDGIIDGAGPLPDFQTFYFDARFGNVVRVEIPTHGWSLDNMVFGRAVVPEPSTFLLLALGSAALWGVRYRRR